MNSIFFRNVRSIQVYEGVLENLGYSLAHFEPFCHLSDSSISKQKLVKLQTSHQFILAKSHKYFRYTNSINRSNTSHLSALRYGDLYLWPVVGAGGDVLDLPHDEEAVDDAAEHHVLLVKEVALGACYEELEKGNRNSQLKQDAQGRSDN